MWDKTELISLLMCMKLKQIQWNERNFYHTAIRKSKQRRMNNDFPSSDFTTSQMRF